MQNNDLILQNGLEYSFIQCLHVHLEGAICLKTGICVAEIL